MKKYLYFATGAPDSTASSEEVVMLEATTISHFEMRTATDMRIYFNETVGQIEEGTDNTSRAVIALDITTGKHKEVMEAISGAICSAGAINAPMIVVADSENSKFLHANITACASINGIQGVD